MSDEAPQAGPRIRAVPNGDDRERLTCPDCGFIAYENPKIVVGSVVHHAGRILLCRRSINPRRGYWTLPAGYLELDETPEEGARREAMEEAGAAIEIDGLLAVYAIRRISQVQLIHRATLGNPDTIAAGVESLEIGLFAWDEIPWDDIAFPSVHWSLAAFRDVGTGPLGPPAGNPPGAEGGLSPGGM